jgi:hypothetical protein
VFDSSTVDEVSEKIEAFIPIREHGANWGILHVKCALARLSIRPPRRKVARALHILAGAYYERRRRGLPLELRQYNVTTPMALWHIDCESQQLLLLVQIVDTMLASVWFLYVCSIPARVPSEGSGA